jgi:hypothetical protein
VKRVAVLYQEMSALQRKKRMKNKMKRVVERKQKKRVSFAFIIC